MRKANHRMKNVGFSSFKTNVRITVRMRADGLPVFLDGDKELNEIRLNEPDPRKVILAVAFRRAQQIACNYALKHAPYLYKDIVKLTRRKKIKTLQLLP